MKNGVPYSTNDDQHRRITAPIALDGPVPEDYLESDNVKNIRLYIPTEVDWDDMFPMRNSIYDYHSFLKAAAKYPAFCNENNISGNNPVSTCGRELATLFAHLSQETGYNDENLKVPPTW